MTDAETFECAYLSVRCLLSGTEAVRALAAESLGGRRTLVRLTTGSRSERARALAAELGLIARDIDRRRLA